MEYRSFVLDCANVAYWLISQHESDVQQLLDWSGEVQSLCADHQCLRSLAIALMALIAITSIDQANACVARLVMDQIYPLSRSERL